MWVPLACFPFFIFWLEPLSMISSLQVPLICLLLFHFLKCPLLCPFQRVSTYSLFTFLCCSNLPLSSYYLACKCAFLAFCYYHNLSLPIYFPGCGCPSLKHFLLLFWLVSSFMHFSKQVSFAHFLLLSWFVLLLALSRLWVFLTCLLSFNVLIYLITWHSLVCGCPLLTHFF